MATLTKEQIKEFDSGAGYDQVPKFIMRFSDAIGSIEGRLLRYLAHRTLGFGQYATVVSTRDLAVVAGTKDNQRAVQWLMAHGVIGRETVKHGGHNTFAYWIHTDFTRWGIPDEVWQRMLALRKQGCWDDPRFASDSLKTLDRSKMVRVSGKEGYNVDDLKARIRTVAKADDGPDDCPNSGAEGSKGRGSAAPNNGAASDPNDGAVTPQYRGSHAPNSGAEQGARGHVPQGLTASVETFERTSRVPQRTGAGLRPAPSAGGAGVIESRSATATPSLDAPATPRPSCDGERTDCRPPSAGGEINDSPPAAGNGGLRTERPTDVDLGERHRLTNDFQHLRVLARQMYRLVWMCVRQFDLGKLIFDGPKDPGFSALMNRIPGKLIDRYEGEVLKLPEGMRTSAEEYHDLLFYARYGRPDPDTIDSSAPGHFHPARYEPRYTSPEDEVLWRQMIRDFDVLSSMQLWYLLESEELRTLETPDDPANFSGVPDLTRILAPPAEDPLAPRAALTDDLHHLRVIARQLERIWGPIVAYVREGMASKGGFVGPDELDMLHGLQRDLARPLIDAYETELLGLPDDLRTTDDEFDSLLRQVWTHHVGERDRPLPWRFHIKLHPPRYSEPADREIWERYLTLIPDGLPEWFVGTLRSGQIVELEHRKKTQTSGGGTSRPDDHETEPYGTEEDGPQPP